MICLLRPLDLTRSIDNIKDRRLYLKKVIAHNKRLKRIDLQQLEQLERLQQLQQLERPRLHITSMDYREVPIKKELVFYRDWETDRKSTRLNSSHSAKSRMPSSA